MVAESFKAEDVIKELQEALASAPPNSRENIYQAALEAKLEKLGVRVERPRLSNPDAGGYGEPDLFLPDTDPLLLIELKSTGDWRAVAEAAAQLYGLAFLLSARPDGQVHLMKLAVFNPPLQSEYLRGLLEALQTRYIFKT